MLDIVIRGGEILDGSGRDGFVADVGIDRGLIVAIGNVEDSGRVELDARDLCVTPGFIDGHTHMDAQMFWEPRGRSSADHGITSAIIGNCGFTLAPSRDGERDLVLRNLERAEDMSRDVLQRGIPWGWETFREYLGILDVLPKAINYGAQIGHSALRTWAMGDRAFTEKALPSDLENMKRELADAVAAGAVGFTSSRSKHMTSDDRPVASRLADWSEVKELVTVLHGTGGVFQMSHDSATVLSDDPDTRLKARAELREVAVESQVRLILGLNQAGAPEGADMLDLLASIEAAGGHAMGMTHSRGISQVYSLKAHMPFDSGPEWSSLKGLSGRELLKELSDPERRKLLVGEAHRTGIATRSPDTRREIRSDDFSTLLYLQTPLPPYRSIADLAEERRTDPVELILDLAIETELRAMFIQFNRAFEDKYLLTAMRDARCVMTFSDSGAHVARIADSSIQTYFLAYWVRERGEFTWPDGIRMLTAAPAEAWGLVGRGRISVGCAADMNVLDCSTISPELPTVEDDFPGGGVHIQQRCRGIRSTIVNGKVTLHHGEATGALPGTMLRRGRDS